MEPFAENITQDEEAKIQQLATLVAPIVDAFAPHKSFCSRGTYLRYLRARSFNLQKAQKMLEDTLKWRESYRPDLLTFSGLEEEALRGKVYILPSPDVEGRPVVFMRPRKEVYGGDNDRRVQYTIYVMEQASKLADAHAPDGKLTWLIDFVGYDRKNQPPFKVSLQVLNIVQNHYPERLGKAANFQPPYLFELFWKAIRPFVDPTTREKVVFLHKEEAHDEIRKYFDPTCLDACIGGDLEEEDAMWDFERYRRRMTALEKGLEYGNICMNGNGTTKHVEEEEEEEEFVDASAEFNNLSV